VPDIFNPAAEELWANAIEQKATQIKIIFTITKYYTPISTGILDTITIM